MDKNIGEEQTNCALVVGRAISMAAGSEFLLKRLLVVWRDALAGVRGRMGTRMSVAWAGQKADLP